MADIHRPLTIAALAVMVVGIGFTLANAWFFFLADPAPAQVAQTVSASDGRPAEVSLEEVAALHLFGRPMAAPGTGETARTESLRETRLSLELVAVVVASTREESRAFIAGKGREPGRYEPGDRLPGNARLVDVYWNRVVISRAGEHELLRFEHDTDGFTRVAASPRPQRSEAREAVRPAAPESPPENARQAMTRYREEFEKAPEKLLADVGVALSDDGEGYVVGALAELPQLSHTGLQPGDRILSVNGSPVGDPNADRLRIEDVLADGAARLEIQRGERRFVVTVAVN